jgi:hypothetical protein
MTRSKLGFVHFCEVAVISDKGLLSMINIIEKVEADKFPLTITKMFLVLNVSAELGAHNFKVKMTEPGGNVVLDHTLEVEVKEGKKAIGLAVNLPAIQVEKPGQMLVEIIVDDLEVGIDRSLDILKLGTDEPENK